MPNNKILPLLWKIEYNSGGIPSSVREKPSTAVERLSKLLSIEDLPVLKGVDLGCGTGRNTLYLGSLKCHVTGLDFVPDMIDALNKKSDQLGLSSCVYGRVADLTGKWGLPLTKYDFFLDTYCFKHIIDLVGRINYKSELLKYSDEGTIFLLTLASTEDGYYSQYPIRTDGGLQVILDPGNDIESILYKSEQVIEFFNPEFEIIELRENIQTNVMHGKKYDRKGFEFVFKRAKPGL
jgi:SAM-dependent methyltransferase